MQLCRGARQRVNAIVVVLLIPVFCALLAPSLVQAQNQGVQRVLVLHGVWTHDRWETALDSALDAGFEDMDVELSSQYLGLDTGLSEEALTSLARQLQYSIEEHNVSLIIAALPSANTFLSERLDLGDIPLIRILPDPELESPQDLRENTVVIESAANEIIASTLEQMLALRPEAEEFLVLGGTSTTDQVYTARAHSILNSRDWPVSIRILEGESPQSVYQLVSELPGNDAVLMLPFESYGTARDPVPLNFFAPVARASSVPVFTIYDASLGSGVVGGHVSTAESIAGQAVSYADAMLNGNINGPQRISTNGEAIYDWPVVERWGLDLDRLSQAYTVLNQPRTLWQERPLLVIIWLNVLLLLLVFIAVQSFLFVRYRRTQQAVSAANAQALENEKKYRFLAENSMDVIWVWDEESRAFGFCSPSIARLTGYSETEFVSEPLDKLFSEQSARLLQEKLQGREEEAVVFEVQQCSKSGDLLWCEIAAKRIANGDKSAGEWVGVTRDISERKKFEKEKSRLEMHVRQAQKFDSLGTLAGGIAHDINNTLGVIYGASDLVEANLPEDSPAQKPLRDIRRASEGAKNLVNQILTFSRQSAATQEVISLNRVLSDSLTLLKTGIPQSVTLEQSIDSEELPILADTTHIEQMILNLLTNAYESMESGNGAITVKLEAVELAEPGVYQFGSLSSGRYAVLSVGDNGKGIPESKLERIFEPFYSSKEQGNGLGLAIVYGVVKDLGGAINVSSIPGSGTVFTVYLPLSNVDVSEKAARPVAKASTMDSLDIVLIDDRKDMLNILSVMLTQLGHNCKPYDNPEEALSDLEQLNGQADLLITDYSMPGMSGLDVVNFCRDKFPALSIFLITGYGDKVLEELSQEQSAVKHILQKPFNMMELKEALATLAEN